MAYLGPVHRWDVFRADLEPTVGQEQAGAHRPVLVVSNDRANNALRTVTIVPLTKREGKTRRFYPWEIQLPKGTVRDNDFTPMAITSQLRTIAKERLIEPAGRLESVRPRKRSRTPSLRTSESTWRRAEPGT